MKNIKQQSDSIKTIPTSAAKPRLTYIDLLKSVAALQVILIHVLSAYEGESEFFFRFWDLIHFAVAPFVFASGILQANSSFRPSTLKEAGTYIWKRVTRIALPYYIFIATMLIAYIITGDFSKLINRADTEYILRTLFIMGGLGGTWIPRLFIGITVVFAISTLLQKRYKGTYLIVTLLSYIYAIYVLLYDSFLPREFENLFGWFAIYMTGYYASNYINSYLASKTSKLESKSDFSQKPELNSDKDSLQTAVSAITATNPIEKSAFSRAFNPKNSFLLAMGGISLVTLLLSYRYLLANSINTGIFAHKYPPDTYFVGYNMLMISIITNLYIWLGEKIHGKLLSAVQFISKYSYEVFFYHLIVIKLLGDFEVNWWIDYAILTSFTLLAVYLKDKIESQIIKRKQTN